MKKKKKEEKEKRKKGEKGTAEVEDDCSASKCRRPTGKQVRYRYRLKVLFLVTVNKETGAVPGKQVRYR
jgi:hypothetical protein